VSRRPTAPVPRQGRPAREQPAREQPARPHADRARPDAKADRARPDAKAAGRSEPPARRAAPRGGSRRAGAPSTQTPRAAAGPSTSTGASAARAHARQAVSRARDQVVSGSSAARFAARARARRWLSWRPVLAALGVLAVLALAGWVVLASPLLAVREIGVVGADRVDERQVVELASGAVGTPMARVDAGAIADEVRRLPLVSGVEVVRAWPGTLEVRLVERVPIAAVPVEGGRFRLLDAEAVVVAEVAEVPGDLPVVQVDVERAGAASLRAASGVLAALPEHLRAEVEQIGATTPDDVRMRLRGGAEVVWGSPADNELKSRVLQALRGQPAAVYDVSAPLTPVTR
jgi:cell division protein FtsQ